MELRAQQDAEYERALRSDSAADGSRGTDGGGEDGDGNNGIVPTEHKECSEDGIVEEMQVNGDVQETDLDVGNIRAELSAAKESKFSSLGKEPPVAKKYVRVRGACVCVWG